MESAITQNKLDKIIDLLEKQLAIQNQLLKFWKQYGQEYEEQINSDNSVNTNPV